MMLKKILKKEIQIFFTAVLFYTRIPCPAKVDHRPDYLNKASRYFPLIGWIVGGISFVVFFLFNYLLTPELAILLAIAASILVTGAFHEDGFADVCDGFGGGWTKEKILQIMKDSAIGAYGAIGLLLLFVLKIYGLFALVPKFMALENGYWYCFLFFVSAHSVSRLSAVSIVFTHQYAREDASSKSRPISQNFTWRELVGALFFGLLPFVLLCTIHGAFVLVLIPVFIIRFYLARYFQKWIGGYTGDCLGATQQVSEIIFNLSFLALWKFI